MLELVHRDITPNQGWDYLPPYGGELIKGGDLGELKKKALRYHVDKGLPTDNLAAVVEDNICRRKDIKCRPPRPAPDGSTRTIGVSDVWRFLKTMIDWCRNASLVEQEEAERRAEICAGCNRNGDITDGSCWGCTNIVGMVAEIIGDRKTRVDHALKNCHVCGCFNAVQAWVPLPVLLRASGSLEYPEDTGQTKDGIPVPCWKRLAL